MNLSTIAGSKDSALANRPYIAVTGEFAGKPVIAVNTGRRDNQGNAIYAERLTANAVLRKDEWLSIDDELVTALRKRLVVTQDMIDAGMTQDMGGLGTLVAEWETGSALTDATVSMDGETTGENDNQEFGVSGVPIPVIHKEFKIGERQLLASRTRGAALDVTTGVEAAYSVARKSEDMIFNGVANGKTKGYNIYGLTNHPSRKTSTLAKDWAATATTGAEIFTDILTMLKDADSVRAFGEFNLYISGDAAYQLRKDYSSSYGKTLLDRILEIDRIKAVRVADQLATKNAVLFNMEKSTADLAIGSDFATVQWQSGSGWTNNFQAYAAWAPRFKADYDGRLAVIHGTKA